MYGDLKPLVPNFLSAVIKIEGKKEAFVGVFDVIPGNIRNLAKFLATFSLFSSSDVSLSEKFLF